MKSIKNIVVTAIILLICSTISIYAVAPTGTGTVNITVAPALTIIVIPSYPFPEDAYNVGRGDTKLVNEVYNVFHYEVQGGKFMSITMSKTETDMAGDNGVSLTTRWVYFPLPGGYPLNEKVFSTASTSLNGLGKIVVRCYISAITATSTAILGPHLIELTLTAAYSY